MSLIFAVLSIHGRPGRRHKGFFFAEKKELSFFFFQEAHKALRAFGETVG